MEVPIIKKKRSKKSSQVFLTSNLLTGSSTQTTSPSSQQPGHEKIKNINLFLGLMKERTVGEDTLDWIQRLRSPTFISPTTYCPANSFVEDTFQGHIHETSLNFLDDLPMMSRIEEMRLTFGISFLPVQWLTMTKQNSSAICGAIRIQPYRSRCHGSRQHSEKKLLTQ